MQIVCPSCTTSCQIADAAIGVNGRSVRCTRCRTVRHAAPPAMAVHVGCAEHDATKQTVAAFRDALVGEPTQQEYDEASAAPTEAPTARSPDDLIGSDGSEQATDAAVARHFPKLPILLMNGYADQRERVSGLEALICDVIAKPFALAEIKFAVASALAKGKRRP